MITNTKKAIRFIFFIIVGFVITSIIVFYIIDRRLKGYDHITKNTHFKGTIDNIKRYKSSTIIQSNKVEYIICGSDNFDYSPPYLSEFIQKGDLIKKAKGNDTLFIHRDGIKYFFVLCETINRN